MTFYSSTVSVRQIHQQVGLVYKVFEVHVTTPTDKEFSHTIKIRHISDLTQIYDLEAPSAHCFTIGVKNFSFKVGASPKETLR